jgi:hypothetical protein
VDHKYDNVYGENTKDGIIINSIMLFDDMIFEESIKIIKEVKMNQAQIDKIIKWLEQKKDNTKAIEMIENLKKPGVSLDVKTQYIQKNIQPAILRKIIY